MKYLFAILLASFPVVAAAAPPDIFFVTVDTLRADRLGCYGYEFDTTPNLDALAARGLLFENVVTEVPLTGPSFGAMLSSRVPRVTGMTRNGLAMADEVPLVAERFQAAGYQTIGVQSNWTLKADMSSLHRGFEIYDDDFRKRRWGLLVAEREGDDVLRIALKQLKDRDTERPLFMWIHFSDPHAPYKKHRGFNPVGKSLRELDKTEQIRARYDSEVAYTDHLIGKFLEAVPEDAIVFFVADHGESLMEHGYLGHGRRIYQNNLHIPLIIAGPGVEPGRVNAPARGLDVGPTLLTLAGLDPFPAMQGVDLLNGAIEANRIRVVETYGGAAIVPGLKDDMADAGPMWQGVLVEDWKLVVNDGTPELYRISEDPGELNDLADGEPHRVRAMERVIEEWTAAHPEGASSGKTLTEEDVEALENLGYL